MNDTKGVRIGLSRGDNYIKDIVADGERAEWVIAPRGGIRKTTLNFVEKFFQLLVQNIVLPMKVENQYT